MPLTVRCDGFQIWTRRATISKYHLIRLFFGILAKKYEDTGDRDSPHRPGTLRIASLDQRGGFSVSVSCACCALAFSNTSEVDGRQQHLSCCRSFHLGWGRQRNRG